MTREALNLRVDGACKTYGDFSLRQVSLEVPAGTILGLIGQNGAGKTTLMKAILGTINLEGGSVELFGKNPAELPEKELVALKARVGYVSAVTAFPQLVTAREVSRTYELSYPGFERGRFDEMCAKLSFDALDKPIKELSRGMGMKVQLACVLASGADLLILDEPTAGLDPIVREEVLDVLREWMEGDGRSILISSHITSDLEHLADTVVLIDDGAVLVDCTADEIAEMGVAHLRATELEQLLSDGGYAPGTLHVLKRDLSYAALVPDRHAFAEAYPEFAVDPAGIDDIMTLLVKGEVR